jgi:hypothetical protein
VFCFCREGTLNITKVTFYETLENEKGDTILPQMIALIS